MPLFRIFAACLILAMPAVAQQNPGLALTHIHLNSADPDAAIAFWKDTLGTSTYARDSLNGVSMPGALIVFTKQAPSGPSTGTALDHLGLRVPDLQPFIAKLAKTPYKSSQPTPNGDVLMIDGPDGVRIELVEDNTMYTSVEFNHIHLQTPQPKETQAWYGKHFGARPGTDDQSQISRLPGATLTFTQAVSAQPTAGRAIDHLSFEIKDLKSFIDTLTADGIKLDPPVQSVVFLTDPWGTRLELTEAPAR